MLPTAPLLKMSNCIPAKRCWVFYVGICSGKRVTCGWWSWYSTLDAPNTFNYTHIALRFRADIFNYTHTPLRFRANTFNYTHNPLRFRGELFPREKIGCLSEEIWGAYESIALPLPMGLIVVTADTTVPSSE